MHRYCSQNTVRSKSSEWIISSQSISLWPGGLLCHLVYMSVVGGFDGTGAAAPVQLIIMLPHYGGKKNKSKKKKSICLLKEKWRNRNWDLGIWIHKRLPPHLSQFSSYLNKSLSCSVSEGCDNTLLQQSSKKKSPEDYVSPFSRMNVHFMVLFYVTLNCKRLQKCSNKKWKSPAGCM